MEVNELFDKIAEAKNKTAIKQYGLYSTSNDEVEEFVKRVNKWNLNHLDAPVKLDILAVENKEGDRDYPGPHYKLLLEFYNRESQVAFWRGYD